MTVIKRHNGSIWVAESVGGAGIPSGGTVDQALTKVSSTDYDTQWSTVLTESAADARYLESAGDTATGAMYVSGNPSAPTEAAPKQYVDATDPAVVAWNPQPTNLAGANGLTKGNGVNTSFYYKTGRTCHITYDFLFGTTTVMTVTGADVLCIPLPFTAANWGPHALGYVWDQSTSELFYLYCGLNTFDRLLLTMMGYGTNESIYRGVSNTTPFTWAVSDHIYFEFTYLTAS